MAENMSEARTWKTKLLIAAGVIAGLFVALVLGGFLISPEVELETHARLDAPPEAIYPHLDELEGLRAWWARAGEETAAQGMPAMTIEHRGGPTQGEGMQLAFVADGQTFETWVVVEREPPSKIVYDVDFQAFVVRRTLTLTPEAEGTTLVTWAETGTIDRPLMRYMTLLPQQVVLANFNAALRALGAVSTGDPARD